jgi:hypothetical protein
MIKFIVRFFSEAWQEYKLSKMLKEDGYEPRVVKLQLNPCCNIEATYKNNVVMKLPLFYMIESFMKDYGYNPESMQDDKLMMKITCSADLDFSFPLYVKKDGVLFNTPMTTRELHLRGYIIPAKRTIVPNPKILESVGNEDKPTV